MGDFGDGWQPDHTGRHELRYYASGQATDLVRDAGTESVDELGAPTALPGPPPAPPTSAPLVASTFGSEPDGGPPVAPLIVEDEDGRAQAESSRSTAPAVVWVTVAILGIAVLGSLAFALVRSSRSDTAASTPTTRRPTTAQLATQVRASVCPGKATERQCSVDGSKAGVLEIVIDKYDVEEDQLVRTGEQFGFWNAADVARMTHTRALDGTQRTSDGRVTWTYHPDNGLQLVVDVGGGTA